MENYVGKGHPARRGKRLSALLLCLCLMAATVPVTVKAGADPGTAEPPAVPVNGKGLGISVIEDPTAPQNASAPWTGSYVYFGTYNGTPVKYRVLDRKTEDYGGRTMLLDCDSFLWQGSDPSSRFDDSTNVWADSYLRKYLNSEGDYSSTGFLKKSFTDREQGAIAESRKASKSGTDGEGRSYLNYAGLNGEKIFLLDAKEATNLSYGYSREGTGANNRIKAGGDGYWWLRSANFDFNNYASIVDSDGELLQYMVNFDFFVGVSPALNVDLSSVLFSSVLPEQNGNGGTSYKLTIHDSGMEIQPGGIGQITRTGDTIRIPYTISGEHGGNATNLSLIVLDKEYTEGNTNGAALLAYQTVSKGADSSAEFGLPDNMPAGSRYYIVAEQIHTDNMNTAADESLLTDYASAPALVDISKATVITKIDSVEIGITPPAGGQELAASGTVAATGVVPQTPFVTWTREGNTVAGSAEYNTVYTAAVTLEADTGYGFPSGVTATVNNVNNGTVRENADGSITISHTFPATAKANLISITNPENITGVANGTEKSAAALGLPRAVTIETEDTNVTSADVIWNVADASYNPSLTTAQSFTVEGEVELPAEIDNRDHISRNVTVQVTVSAAGVVDMPQASPAAGTYTGAIWVELATATPGAVICYTVDGSTPTAGSTRYSGAILVDRTMTIKAIAMKEGMEDSAVATAAYTIEDKAPVEKPWIFTDVDIVPGNWKYESVKHVYNNDIMGAITGTTQFQPDRPLSRAMFATVLYRMAGEPEAVFRDKFTDVPAGKWYSDAIIWAYQNKVAAGYTDGSFGIDDNITREQIAKMLFEYAKVSEYDISERNDLGSFTDEADVSSWAVEYMQWAAAVKMITGKPNDDGKTWRMDPKGDATRAECAAMLKRFAEKYVN